MEIHHISKERLTIDIVAGILNKKIALSEEVKELVVKCRKYLDEKIKTHKYPIYGINTGFGSLCNTSISNDDLGALQKNLVMSHACGIGDEVPQDIVKLMLLLKIQGLSYGHSGVQLVTIERLVGFYNNDVLPVIYQQGSLGASGDLAPLAHLALPLIGMGEVYYKGQKRSSEDVLNELDWQPIELQSKEGLALLNGTQFMSAYGVWNLLQATKLSNLADKIGALSLEAFDGRIEPFDDDVHYVRSHSGQLQTARNIKSYLAGSEIVARKKEHVQDPYSFRCMPQVHGASKDAIAYITSVFETEINSVTDNPTIFPDEDKIISAGNFHGQPLAISFDFLAIAVAELGSISERRVYKLIAGERGLPAFLVANPGLNSGFMIPQYTAAPIASQNKHLCAPASVDTIDSSQGQEDHVSMGANAATKCYKVVENLEKLLAIELLNAAQAIEFREENTSEVLSQFVADYRKSISFVKDDRYLHEDIKKSVEFIKSI
ncbi:MAG: histidine ammonia-lyase [Flavobacteriales bacterium]|nr:histidine ammonia-lyase [Flavobacteriales bacterium]